jgi:hypothetical protein
MVFGNSETMIHTDPYVVNKISNAFGTHGPCTKSVNYLSLTTNKPLKLDM